MKIRLRYSTEIYINGDNFHAIREIWEKINLDNIEKEIKDFKILESQFIGIDYVEVIKDKQKDNTELIEYFNNKQRGDE